VFESTVIGTLFNIGTLFCSETLYSGQWTVHSVRCIQPTVFFFHTKSAPVSSYQPANIIFLSQQISTSHSTANRVVVVMRSGENLLDSCWFVQSVCRHGPYASKSVMVQLQTRSTQMQAEAPRIIAAQRIGQKPCPHRVREQQLENDGSVVTIMQGN